MNGLQLSERDSCSFITFDRDVRVLLSYEPLSAAGRVCPHTSFHPLVICHVLAQGKGNTCSHRCVRKLF